MHITDYIINIENTSFADRLRLRQVLLDNNQQIWKGSQFLMIDTFITKGLSLRHNDNDSLWNTTIRESNITIQDFIAGFKRQNQLKDLAFYKRSGEPWSHEEFVNIANFCKTDIPYNPKANHVYKRKYVFKHENNYEPWNSQDIKDCLEVAYEDVFVNEYTKDESKNELNNRLENSIQKLEQYIKDIKKEIKNIREIQIDLNLI